MDEPLGPQRASAARQGRGEERQPRATWTALTRGGDGTLTDASGFGVGTFSIRSTGVDGSAVVDTFDWPSNGIAGAFLTGKGNFD